MIWQKDATFAEVIAIEMYVVVILTILSLLRLFLIHWRMQLPTLNVNVSQETLDKLESLKQFGKGKVVSIAIQDLQLERLVELLMSQVDKKRKYKNEK